MPDPLKWPKSPSNQAFTDKKNNTATILFRWNPVTCRRGTGSQLAQCPPSAFVFLKGGNPGVINKRSVTWDCFLPSLTERNMKWGFGWTQGHFIPLWPILFFQVMLLFILSSFSSTLFVHKSVPDAFYPRCFKPLMELLWRRTEPQQREKQNH